MHAGVKGYFLSWLVFYVITSLATLLWIILILDWLFSFLNLNWSSSILFIFRLLCFFFDFYLITLIFSYIFLSKILIFRRYFSIDFNIFLSNSLSRFEIKPLLLKLWHIFPTFFVNIFNSIIDSSVDFRFFSIYSRGLPIVRPPISPTDVDLPPSFELFRLLFFLCSIFLFFW